jgi:diaminopimelate decarboxylase
LRRLRDAFAGQGATFCYAVKANSNLAVIRTLARAGAWADVVSGGELERALAAGVPPARIVFAGVGKSREEMGRALEVGIHQFNVESVPELVALSEVAAAGRRRAPVALRINPDVAAGGHEKIRTGRRGDKFGIAYADASAAYATAARLAGIEVVGLHLHVGSQITDLAPFEAAYRRGAELVRRLRAEGHAIRRLDLGGGFGARYRDDEPAFDAEAFAAMVRRVTGDLDHDELLFEPGRVLVAEAGVLVARVLYVKEDGERPFVVLDAGMNNLVRPAMYGAYHGILPVAEPAAGAPLEEVAVVGPICESADVFSARRALPPLRAGDLVAFTGAGAYGAVMASDYNSRPAAAEVLVEGDRFAVVKRRIEPVERLRDEVVPDWLAGEAPGGAGTGLRLEERR